jgi:outer membrane protein OmpA-like peptidoglycan-associated protein
VTLKLNDSETSPLGFPRIHSRGAAAIVGAGLMAAGVSATATQVQAQAHPSVQLDQFRPAVTAEDGFQVNRPDDRGHLRFGAQLSLDYANNPLVYERTLGMAGSEQFSIVENQLAAHVGLSFSLVDRIVLYATLPVNLLMSGTDTPPTGFARADGTGLGDVWAGGRIRLFGERNDVFALAVQATFILPTAMWANANQYYSGDQGLVVHPELLGELRFGGGWRLTMNVGGRIRAVDQSRLLTNFNVSHELTGGLGLSIPIWSDAEGRSVAAQLEAYGATSFENFANRETSPLEAILGIRAQPICGFNIGLAGGTGLSRGYGSPDFRGILSLGWSDSQCPTEAAPVTVEEPVIGDIDHDGILDNVDQCPNEPEDVDTFEDENGCPDPDNDSDGVLDVNDGAPMDPEDPDGFEDTDGVPDPDNDHDGILDAQDRCPLEAEDRDGFQDEDGCPEPDNDQDTVVDPNDQCPLAPGRPEDNGCPRTVRLDTETGTIFILQRVEFATNRDVILDRSFPILVEVAAIMQANPQLRRLRIEGHTDDRGRDAANLDLSRRRAASVIRWLSEHQVEGARMEGWGCGELHPMETNATADGRQANRRVEFHIVDPAPPGGARTLEGCIAAQ